MCWAKATYTYLGRNNDRQRWQFYRRINQQDELCTSIFRRFKSSEDVFYCRSSVDDLYPNSNFGWADTEFILWCPMYANLVRYFNKLWTLFGINSVVNRFMYGIRHLKYIKAYLHMYSFEISFLSLSRRMRIYINNILHHWAILYIWRSGSRQKSVEKNMADFHS